jgi:hypothetical protein
MAAAHLELHLLLEGGSELLRRLEARGQLHAHRHARVTVFVVQPAALRVD